MRISILHELPTKVIFRYIDSISDTYPISDTSNDARVADLGVAVNMFVNILELRAALPIPLFTLRT